MEIDMYVENNSKYMYLYAYVGKLGNEKDKK